MPPSTSGRGYYQRLIVAPAIEIGHDLCYGRKVLRDVRPLAT
jgi:hypothetical protein